MALASCEVDLMIFTKHKGKGYIHHLSRLWKQVLWHWKTVGNPELLAFWSDGSRKGRLRLMSDRQAPKKRPQIIRAPEIGVISPKTSSLTERWTTVHWNERESTKKQKQLVFCVDNLQLIRSLGSLNWTAKIYYLDLAKNFNTQICQKINRCCF